MAIIKEEKLSSNEYSSPNPSTSSGQYRINVLNTLEEIPTWMARCRVTLARKDLWHPKTNGPLDTAEASGILLDALSNYFVDQLASKGYSAPTIWAHITSLYQVSDLSTKTSTLQELVSFNHSAPSALDNETEILNIGRRLKLAFGGEQAIQIDDLICLFTLAGLPSRYAALKTTIEETKATITTEELFKSIRREDQSQKSFANRASTKPLEKMPKSIGNSVEPKASAKATGSCPHGFPKEKCFKCTKKLCLPCKELGIDRYEHVTDSDYCKYQQFKHRGGEKPAAVRSARSVRFNPDSGATDHIVSNKGGFEIYSLSNRPIEVASGQTVYATAIGGLNTDALPIENVLLCPSVTENLLSISQLASKGYDTLFTNEGVVVGKFGSIGNPILRGPKLGDRYIIDIPINSATDVKLNAARTLQDWHECFNHLSPKALQNMARNKAVEGLEIKQDNQFSNCEACLLGKARHGPNLFPSTYKPSRCGALVHTDLAGPIRPSSVLGHQYLLSITDEFSGYIQAFPIQSKADVFNKIREYDLQLFNSTSHHIQYLRSDNGSEFKNSRLSDYCKANGIRQQFTNTYEPQQNGVAERANLTIFNPVRASLLSSGLPKTFWCLAAEYVVFTRNLSINSANSMKTPFELWHGFKPTVAMLQPFGAICFSFINATLRQKSGISKLTDRAARGRLIGINLESKGYRILRHDGKIISATYGNVVFPQNNIHPCPPPENFESLHSEWTSATSDCRSSEQLIESPQSSVAELNPSSPLSSLDADDRTTHTPAPAGVTSAIPDVITNDLENTYRDLPGSLDRSPAPAGNPFVETDPFIVSMTEPAHLIPQRHSKSNPSHVAKGDLEYQAPELEKVYKSKGWGKWKAIEPETPTRLPLPAKRTRNTVNYADNSATPSSKSTVQTAKAQAYSSMVLKTLTSLGTVDSIITLTNHGNHQWFRSKAYSATTPHSYKAIAENQDSEEWYKASNDEISQLVKFGVWTLVPAPDGVNILKNKWVFRIKEKDGVVVRYKARLCACGYSQIEGTDYKELFAPTVHSTSLRLELLLVASRKMHTKQMDVTGAFLNGVPDETLYMRQPEGFYDQNHPNWVCKLLKNLYGLKQASRVWHLTVDPFIKSLDFSASADPCLYFRYDGPKLSLLALHVDDITLSSDCKIILESIGDSIKAKFAVTDDGEISEILKLKVTRDIENRKLYLSQQHYIQESLAKFNMLDATTVATPMDSNTVSAADCPLPGSQAQLDMANVPYREACGTLMSLALNSRPDISYAVGVGCRFMHNPGPAHWNLIKRIFRYLKGTLDLRLCLGGSTLDLQEFQSIQQPSEINGQSKFNSRMLGILDADWAGDRDNARSTSGYCFFIGSSLLSWSSRLQATPASSTTHAEYFAAYHSTVEALWLRTLLNSINLLSPAEPTVLFSDNTGAIQLGKHHMITQRSKHFDTKLHLVRDSHQAGNIALQYIPTKSNIADILTKPLPTKQFLMFRSQLGLVASVTG